MSYTHCDLCGQRWDGHGSACRKFPTLNSPETFVLMPESDTIRDLRARLAEAERERDELLAAAERLKELADHRDGCAVWSEAPRTCTCGYATAYFIVENAMNRGATDAR